MARRPLAIARLGPIIGQQLIGSKSKHPAKHCGIFTEVPGVTMSKPSKMQERIANRKTKKVSHGPENLETTSVGLYLNRNGGLDILNPDNLPASEAQEVLNDIAIAVIVAGFEGIKIDETRLSNGKYVQVIAANMTTYEGLIFQGLKAAFDRNEPLPRPDEILALLKISYSSGGGND